MPSKKLKAWVSSEGKKLLDGDIQKGDVTPDMSKDEIFSMHCAEYEHAGSTPQEAYRLFDGRLKRAFARGGQDSARSAVEAAALHQDWLTHPRPAMFAGAPQWPGSEAEHLLKEDVAAGKHVGKTPT